MNSSIQNQINLLAPTSLEVLEKLDIANEVILKCDQELIATEHIIHGGMYIRTIRLKPNTKMIGSLISLATVLIVHGETALLVGNQMVEISGYNVIPGCAGRKQLFVTRSEVEMTMIFPTRAKTVEDAENEVFSESDMLMSRWDDSRDTVIITGY